MNRKEVTILWEVINQLNFTKANPKFTFAISKNKKILLPIMKEIEQIKRSEKFLEYDDKRKELCIKFSEKDENGSPVIRNDNYVIPSDSGFKEAFEILKVEYEDTLKEEDKKGDEEVEVELHKVNVEDVPEELSIQEMDILMDVLIVDI